MSVSQDCPKRRLSIMLDPSEENVVYEVSARGARPLFVLVDSSGRRLLSDADEPDADGVWRRKWPLSPSEIPDSQSTTHTLGMQFLGAIAYTWRVKRNGPGSQDELVKHCNYESQSPEEEHFDTLQLRGLQG